MEFEVQDQHAALAKILKAHGMYRENTEGSDRGAIPQINVRDGGSHYQQFNINPGERDSPPTP